VIYNPIIAPNAVILPAIIALLTPKVGIVNSAEEIFPPINIRAMLQ